MKAGGSMAMSHMKHVFQFVSPANETARLSVLIFHRVHSRTDPLFPGEPDAEFFDKALGWMKSWFNVLPLDEAASRLKTQTLPARAAAITFDDGYADNYHVALPILKKHGLTATFFIATGFLNGGIMWNDCVIELARRTTLNELDLDYLGLGRHSTGTLPQRRAAIDGLISQIKYLSPNERQELVNKCVAHAQMVLPTDLMMTSDEVRGLRAAGMQIGAHTITHPILASTGIEFARKEISESKAFLEDLLGEPIGLFAYPNGKPGVDYLPEHSSLVQQLGFDAAVSTAQASAATATDPYQIPRFTPWDRTKTRFGLRLLQNYYRNP